MKPFLWYIGKKGLGGIIVAIFFLLTIGVYTYAQQITSVQTQTIGVPWSIEKDWYQDVNDRIKNIFSSGGNIGIMKSTPSYTLDVSGSINAPQLCLNGNCKTSWPIGGTGGTIVGNLRWTTNTYTGKTYDQAWTTCLSLSPAGSWRIPDTDEIEQSYWINPSLFPDAYWTTQPYWDSSSPYWMGGYYMVRGNVGYWPCAGSQASCTFDVTPVPIKFRCVTNL